MKKILLTSAGFLNPKIAEEFLKLVASKDTKILMVAYAQNEDELFYINESKKELVELGFDNIYIFNMNNNESVDSLESFDVVYVCGGNTFSILGRMKEIGLFSFIKKQIEKGSVFVGVSAGSIIAGQNIDIAEWGSEGDPNDVNLKDLSGFGFTDIAIFPHFREDLEEEVESFRKKVNYPVMELTDNQALLIIDGKENFIE